ncbi:50S ribosomal protein L18e [Candidatus Woesearchaeota archaeon]|nr:50S ribosomal protein L18e [Candidatus Woesearchaeota archaeon]MBW3016605.1 50S ribosomal protein L18e [Candidatus Woesearchaeota archaeon]
MKRTGPTNPVLKELIQSLRKESTSSKAALWDRVADDLEKSTRQRRVVNVSCISRFTKPNETVIVPGKVLGSGAVAHSVVVAALSFSQGARERIEEAKGKAITIEQLLKQKPKARDLRLLG